ncbi:hypothetical protein OS493_013785 [Desmophyllum pertusum]|uniref:TIP41-like protein n=1 Tax=Desmophyllum pertusum TaxID=174260 RepID=A0A9X0D3C1_9CNID|nr:hypothetical protein OS493_013785 [Desmophyllum pertusum]
MSEILIVFPVNTGLKIIYLVKLPFCRQDSEYIKEVIKPFDWTFTTDYKGTLTGKEEIVMKIESTKERIDMEQLKVKEKIYFYEDIILYEDELADNGIAKIKCQNACHARRLLFAFEIFPQSGWSPC